MKLYKIYFSPTGGTKRILDIVAAAWNDEDEKEEIDLTDSRKDFSKYMFQKEDICIVAVPSFGGRVPEIAITRLSQFKSQKAKAVLLCAYGNRAYEDTLLELEESLTAGGFQCIAAAAAVAEHSIMHQFGNGRPDRQDEKELMEFGKKIKEKLEGENDNKNVKVPGNIPYREYNGLPLKPKADKRCTQCGVCVGKCPVNAIKKEKPSLTDETKCISCMRCVSICPKNARKLNKIMVMAASQKMKTVCSTRKNNELFL